MSAYAYILKMSSSITEKLPEQFLVNIFRDAIDPGRRHGYNTHYIRTRYISYDVYALKGETKWTASLSI